MTKIRFLVDHEDMSTVTSYFRPELKDHRDYVNQGGLSRTAIFNQVDDCLARLGTDYIDILMIHMTDDETPFEETMCALNDLVRSNKVRYLGASNVRTWKFIEMNNVAQLNGWAQFSCVQMEHSLCYRTEVRCFIPIYSSLIAFLNRNWSCSRIATTKGSVSLHIPH
jgi:aryl-alcohol dehydrogenase-like predicted oxidoreductase